MSNNQSWQMKVNHFNAGLARTSPTVPLNTSHITLLLLFPNSFPSPTYRKWPFLITLRFIVSFKLTAVVNFAFFITNCLYQRLPLFHDTRGRWRFKGTVRVFFSSVFFWEGSQAHYYHPGITSSQSNYISFIINIPTQDFFFFFFSPFNHVE